VALHIHIHHEADAQTTATLTRIEMKLDAAYALEKINMKTLDDVLAETARQTTIETSTEAFIAGLQSQINAAGGNQAKIDAVFAALKANNDKAAAALVNNTPVAPPAVP
jgi:hypothetical protein